MTLEERLAKESDATLIAIQEELLSGLVPSSGHARTYCRKLNELIDKGKLCINPTTYRHVYLPTLHSFVSRELSARYCAAINKGRLNADWYKGKKHSKKNSYVEAAALDRILKS